VVVGLKFGSANIYIPYLGHEAKDCTERRVMDLSKIPDKTPREAVAMMEAASDARDLDDFREVSKHGVTPVAGDHVGLSWCP